MTPETAERLIVLLAWVAVICGGLGLLGYGLERHERRHTQAQTRAWRLRDAPRDELRTRIAPLHRCLICRRVKPAYELMPLHQWAAQELREGWICRDRPSCRRRAA